MRPVPGSARLTARLETGRVLRRWRGLLAVCLCCAVGCRGGGRIELASLNYRAIDPPAAPPPRVARINLDCCYWWTDDDGRLWIAMQREQALLLSPKWRLQFQRSLALEKLPAGSARDYKITRKALRARLRVGPWEGRFASQAGIIALYREPHDVLRGSMRLQASRTTTRLLGGWSKPTPYLILGSFTAIRDERRGRAIVEATESSGWGRDVPTRPRRGTRPPSSQPTAAPATAETKPSRSDK